jgi:hypothetical protein
MIHYSAEVKPQNVMFFYSTWSIHDHLDVFMFSELGRKDASCLTPAEDRVIKRLKRFMFNVIRYKDRAQHSFVYVNLNTGVTTVILNGDLHDKKARAKQSALTALQGGLHQPIVPALPAKNDHPKEDVCSSDTRTLVEVRVCSSKSINYMNREDREHVLLFVCRIMEIDIIEETRRAFERGERILEGLQTFLDSIDQSRSAAELQFVLVDQVDGRVCSVINYWHVL